MHTLCAIALGAVLTCTAKHFSRLNAELPRVITAADSPWRGRFGNMFSLEAANMNVAHLLRTLGLEQYEALFRANDIEIEAFDDLKDLGVHRKKLLEAIAELAGANGNPSKKRRLFCLPKLVQQELDCIDHYC